MTLDPWNIFTASFGHMPKPCTAFVTLLDMVLYFVLTLNVARARTKFGIEVPRTDGPEDFLRILRVQQNTLEQLALHLPLLWISAYAMDDVFAASFGVLWTFGRILYARGYYLKATRRKKGFVISMLINMILFAGALTGTIVSF